MSPRHHHRSHNQPDLLRLYRVRQDALEHLPGSVAIGRAIAAPAAGMPPAGRFRRRLAGVRVLYRLASRRAPTANLINQALFYLSWLQDHRAEFRLLVEARLGSPACGLISWTAAPDLRGAQLSSV